MCMAKRKIWFARFNHISTSYVIWLCGEMFTLLACYVTTPDRLFMHQLPSSIICCWSKGNHGSGRELSQQPNNCHLPWADCLETGTSFGRNVCIKCGNLFDFETTYHLRQWDYVTAGVYLFIHLFICLLVCLLARLHKKVRAKVLADWRIGWHFHRRLDLAQLKAIRFWWWSGSAFGSSIGLKDSLALQYTAKLRGI